MIKRGVFILKDTWISFYSGDLDEIEDLDFNSDKIIGKNIFEIFDSEELISKINQPSGFFDYKKNNFTFKTSPLFLNDKHSYRFLEIECETDENISFYSMLIHEIKNPLAAVRTLVQSLSDYISEDLKQISENSYKTSQDYFSRIITEIDRLNRLLTSVKYISKHVHAFNIKFDIKTIAQNTINIFENTLKDKNIKLITKFPKEEVIFLGDPDQIQQIFNNLITNAIESMENSDNREIIFSIDLMNNRRISISIEDKGKGIDKNDLSKIFKAFYTKKIGGMGIGLTVVKMILKKYNGTLDIESKPGIGTKVNIILPLTQF
jgi:signal transduction histidine kinase